MGPRNAQQLLQAQTTEAKTTTGVQTVQSLRTSDLGAWSRYAVAKY